jgi:competence protein ComEC
MAGLPMEGILDPGVPVGKEVYLDVLGAAEDRKIPWRRARAGDSLNLDGVALRVLSPAPDSARGMPDGEVDANEASLVLELRFGAFSALLTGDAPVGAEASFVGAMLSERVQLLKVGHHGSATSTSPELLARISPETAIISVGRRNRYGHPHPAILRRLEGAGTTVFRTDRSGTIRVKARPDGSYRVVEIG